MQASKLYSLGAVFLVILLEFGIWIFYGFLEFFLVADTDPLLSLLIESFFEILWISLLVIVFCRYCRLTAFEIGFHWQGQTVHLLIASLVGLTAFSMSGLADQLPTHFLPEWMEATVEYDFVHIYKSSHASWKPVVFVLFGLLTPIAEEVLYRGLIFALLRRAFSMPATLLISSSLFGVVHVFPLLFVVAFVMGCLLGWLRERSKSLLGPTLAHATYNAAVLLTS